MNKSQLTKAFINAVNTWKAYVKARITANKQNDKTAKSLLGKAVFYWIKQAEYLKKQLDVILGLKVV